MTVPDEAPKHIEWADRMAQQLMIVGNYVGALKERFSPDQVGVSSWFESIEKALADLDKVRDEIINSENLEEELHDLIECILNWDSPVNIVDQAQSAQRVLLRIVHVGDTTQIKECKCGHDPHVGVCMTKATGTPCNCLGDENSP